MLANGHQRPAFDSRVPNLVRRLFIHETKHNNKKDLRYLVCILLSSCPLSLYLLSVQFGHPASDEIVKNSQTVCLFFFCFFFWRNDISLRKESTNPPGCSPKTSFSFSSENAWNSTFCFSSEIITDSILSIATAAATFLCVFLRAAAWCLFVSKQISLPSSLYRCCLFHRHYIPIYVIRWGCCC